MHAYTPDGLYHVSQDMSLVTNNTLVTLTPNVIEFVRLWKAAGFNDNELYTTDNDNSSSNNSNNKKLAPTLEHVSKLATHMGHVTIVLKSEYDHISDGHTSITCHILGGLKRCGGLGMYVFTNIICMNTRKSYIYVC
jgi:NAD(P)H-hydrate repair Nnr-like enzyme with NAD(P)H-hydrate dehydratase domain